MGTINIEEKELELLEYDLYYGENVMLKIAKPLDDKKVIYEMMVRTRNNLRRGQKKIVLDTFNNFLLQGLLKKIKPGDTLSVLFKFVGPHFKNPNSMFINFYAYVYQFLINGVNKEEKGRKILNDLKIDWIIE